MQAQTPERQTLEGGLLCMAFSCKMWPPWKLRSW